MVLAGAGLMLTVLALHADASVAAALDYPVRPIRLVVPFAAGGTSDILGRILSARMQETIGQHVPYKSASAAYPDVFSGRVSIIFDTVLSMTQHLKSERLRPLAVTTPARARSLPDLPTMSEAGLPGYAMTLWLAVFAPAGSPLPSSHNSTAA